MTPAPAVFPVSPDDLAALEVILRYGRQGPLGLARPRLIDLEAHIAAHSDAYGNAELVLRARGAHRDPVTRDPDELLSLKAAAARAGVHPGTLRRWVRAGTLPTYRIGGGRPRVRVGDLTPEEAR